MELVDVTLALRGSSALLLLLLSALLLRDARASLAGRLAAAFAVGSAAYALVPVAGAGVPTAWRAPLAGLASGDAFVFWMFTRALFDDGFVACRWHAAAWTALVGAGLYVCTAGGNGAWPFGSLLDAVGVGLLVLAAGQSLSSWSVDLVEGRRRLRVFIVAAATLHGGVDGIMRLLRDGDGASPEIGMANAATLLVIVLVVVWATIRAEGGEILSPPAATEDNGGTPEPGRALGATIDPEDRRLAAALARLMVEERLYRQDGLTIGRLAARLGCPEYRLRRVINRTLGHRNFNAYLNGHRIAEAKSALGDPAQAEVPITTIALDAGFQSLGPFNRAFKGETGVTPSEYRRARTG